MAWAKLHTDMLGDPKLMRAARAGLRGLDLLPWLVLFAKQADDGGRLSVGGSAAEPADLAPMIPGATVKLVAACCESAQAIGILAPDDDGVLHFVRWKARQSKPSDTPDGWRDRKQRQRAKGRDNTEEVTPEGGVTVTQTEERRGEEKRQSTLSHAKAAANWPAELAAVLSLVGPVTPGRLGKQLAPLLRDNPHLAAGGVPLLLEAGRAYARSVERMDQQQASRLKHPHDFISRAGFWVDQVRPGGLLELVGEA